MKWFSFPRRNEKKNRLQTGFMSEDSPMTCPIHWLTVFRNYHLTLYDHHVRYVHHVCEVLNIAALVRIII